jgi:transposase
MVYPESISYDIIDSAPFHKANSANIKKGKVSIEECYENQEVTLDFVPRGYPEYNPMEQLFKWLKQWLRKNAKKYNNGV